MARVMIPPATVSELARLLLEACTEKRAVPRILFVEPTLAASVAADLGGRARIFSFHPHPPAPFRRDHPTRARLPCVLGDLASLPLRSESLEGVVDFGALQCVADPGRALDEIRRVVGGGRLFWVADSAWDPSLPEKLRARYFEILSGQEPQPFPSDPDFACIHRILRPGDRVRVRALENGNWTALYDLQDLLGRPGAFLLPAAIPEDSHRRVMRGLRRWCASQFPADHREHGERFLEIREVRLVR